MLADVEALQSVESLWKPPISPAGEKGLLPSLGSPYLFATALVANGHNQENQPIVGIGNVVEYLEVAVPVHATFPAKVVKVPLRATEAVNLELAASVGMIDAVGARK